MRKLTYDCYFRGDKIKTVESYEEANEWKAENRFNSVKERLVEVSERKELSEEDKAHINKIIEAIKSKSKNKGNAAIV